MSRAPFNLFRDIPKEFNQELVAKLIDQDAVRVERIVSRGQASPMGFWYDQEEHEWVAVLAGMAHLQIKGVEQLVMLHAGDTYHLPAHTKHRVAWTAPNEDTIWLAVHWKSK